MTARTLPLDTAIKAAGDVLALATALGVSRQFIYKARKRGWVSPERAAQIETLYGIPKASLMDPRLVKAVAG